MYFRKLFHKNEELLKKEILYDFMVLEKYHKTPNGESRHISLHAPLDFSEDRESYYKDEFYIYLNVDEITEDVKEFIERYDFEKCEQLPKDLKFLLGVYGVTIRAIDGFIP